MSSVIKVENLNKKYLISHKEQASYGSLREEIMESAKRFGKKIIHPFSKQGVISNSQEEFWALKDVSFDIKQGQRVGIIGRNGAGKSTILKILSRITEPTSGRITLRGRVASLLEVGTGFHPELTGRENVFLNGAILGMSRAEIKKKFDEIVAFADIERFLDTPVKRYSSGMYVRLAFAVAAHLEPEILIVDEVLAVGDADFQKKCLGKMEDVGREGRTVLFVSHNMAAVRKLCDSAILLKSGEVNCFDTTEKVLENYLQQAYISDDQPYLAYNEELDVKLRSLDYLNAKKEPSTALKTGEAASFRLVFDTKKRFNDLLVSIAFDTLDENHVCILHSRINGSNIEISPSSTNIYCNIPKMTLSPSKYKLSIKVMSGSKMLFWLPNAIEVEIEDGDFFGTGKLPDRGWSGVCFVEHEWKDEHL